MRQCLTSPTFGWYQQATLVLFNDEARVAWSNQLADPAAFKQWLAVGVKKKLKAEGGTNMTAALDAAYKGLLDYRCGPS
jgi:hypothetical protein